MIRPRVTILCVALLALGVFSLFQLNRYDPKPKPTIWRVCGMRQYDNAQTKAERGDMIIMRGDFHFRGNNCLEIKPGINYSLINARCISGDTNGHAWAILQGGYIEHKDPIPPNLFYRIMGRICTNAVYRRLTQ